MSNQKAALSQLPHEHITDPENLRLLLAEAYRREELLEQRITEMRRTRFRNFGDEETWLWDAHGNNYLDSLVCPVIIHASDLRDIRNALEYALYISTEMPDNAGTKNQLIQTALNEALLPFTDKGHN